MAHDKELSVDLLKEDPKNARRMPRQRLAGLKISMHEYGDLSGITWNEQVGDLVCGHQRMKVLRAAGAKTWRRLSDDEGVIVHPKTKQQFKIRIVRWDEPKHREAQIVANNPHIQGEYTGDLVGQLRELEDTVMFAALGLDDLQKEVDKDLAVAEKEFEESRSKGPAAATFADKYLVIVECRDDQQQRDLLERLAGDGLVCRALVQ